MQILVVDDEVNVVSFIKRGLEEKNHTVDVAYEGNTALRLINEKRYDFYILDVIMPHINGLELCKRIRAIHADASIIVLTALRSTDSVVEGLDSGADDYLTKPFRFDELLARVRAIDRRKQKNIPVDTILQIADLEMNCDTKIVKRAGKVITMTAREFNLLEFLLRNRGRVMSRVQILENVWETNYDLNSNVIDVYINYLRNKIDKGFSPTLLQTVIGMGYVIKDATE